MLKKTVAAFVAILAMSACSGHKEQHELTPDQKFDAVMIKGGYEEFAHDPDGYAAGHRICRLLDSMGMDDTMLALASTGYNPKQLGTVLAASVIAYCPEYGDEL
jgi:hypothetical protein